MLILCDVCMLMEGGFIWGLIFKDKVFKNLNMFLYLH